jgi:hypothetical protein
MAPCCAILATLFYPECMVAIVQPERVTHWINVTQSFTKYTWAPSCLDANNGKRHHQDKTTNMHKVTSDIRANNLKNGVLPDMLHQCY